MDRWEFFQDGSGFWRWRRTSEDGQVMLSSTDAYRSRTHAVANASTRGYAEGAQEPELEIELEDGTFVNLKALPEDAAAADRGARESEPLRRTSYNPYDTEPALPQNKHR